MKTILVPVDFSPVTERVCNEALAFTRLVAGRMILLHSVPPPIINSDYPPGVENIAALTTASEKAARRQMAALQKRLSGDSMVVESAIYFGSPIPHIIDHANTVGADYIFMGSHGHSALYDLLVGSAAQGVLKHAPCPVVIVPPDIKKASKVAARRRGIRKKVRH